MKLPHLRWYIAALLFAASTINYVDRQVLSVLEPVLTKELHLTTEQYAGIVQWFLIAYTVMYLVSGAIADRWGTRLSMGAFMGWWSIANMLHAFARTALGLGAFRVLLGIGEPGNFMAASKASSEWFPPKERAFVNGLVQAGASVGAIVAPPLVWFLTQRWGWHAAFVITGATGLVWLVPWFLLYRLPVVRRDRAPTVRWNALLRFPQTWGLFFSRFLADPVWWFYLFWLPKYLADQRGFTMSRIALLAWLPYLTADLGSIAGGLLSGWLVKRGWTTLRARRTGMWPFALIMPLSVFIPTASSSTAALAIICVVTFAHMAWKTNQATVTNDIYPEYVVGSVSGITAFGNGLGGAAFTWLTGLVVQHFSYRAIFVIMGFLHPAAYVLFRLLVRRSVEMPDQPATLNVKPS